ncbi:uncharacterized protein K489DRAFT_378306 [Dissoconium aciculare CBS 342.82]|uniref:Aminoglycoside phosphotransferase domain-containing protein n=1 Tax=Dissoconium aciculare CBS 342.82 TaxID=1314786 RepID=A0A6J3M7E7_9PEZI|nr:uncharacterized protein K489DRAFT_378306 [Dissoconium aciculare CBS 342.82]KAF1823930.1 hypothetical protein K489DRAFT_378306 [Dissoconium aciculare CBS 342.82]
MAVSETTTITVEYEQAFCTLDGFQEELRGTEFTVVYLFHLTPAASVKFASFRQGLSHLSIDQDTASSRAIDGFQDNAREALNLEESNDRDNAVSARTRSPEEPLKLILKSYRDETLMADEVTAYDMMQRIQGTVTPELYGTCSLRGPPTIVLEYIIGMDLLHHKNDLENFPKLVRAVENCYKQISDCGVVQWDPRLDGIILTDPSRMTVRMIDFSHVEFSWSPANWSTNDILELNESNSHDLLRRYSRRMGWKLVNDVSTWDW